MSTEIIARRNPKRGKAHRLHPAWGGVEVAFCGNGAWDMTEHLPLDQVAPEDRCSRCFPVPASSEREGQR